MGINKTFIMLVGCLVFAFAKAQTAMTPQQYYTFINTTLEEVQEKQWDYYQNLVYKNAKKSSNSREKWLKEIELKMNSLLRAGTNGHGALQEATYEYLVQLRSYQVEDYDYIMVYDFPETVQGYHLTSYLENSKNATAKLNESRGACIAALEYFKNEFKITEQAFYEKELNNNILKAEIGFSKMQNVYITVNNARLNQLKFFEAFSSDNVNAMMQLYDALKNENSILQLEHISQFLDQSQDSGFITDCEKTYDHLKTMGIKTAPDAIALVMNLEDEELIKTANPELQNMRLIKKEEASYKTIISALSASKKFMQVQAVNLASHQRSYLKRYIAY